ncbi:MAG: hypothetical protein AAFW01_17465, partial [Pseudomonadota bacterium]
MVSLLSEVEAAAPQRPARAFEDQVTGAGHDETLLNELHRMAQQVDQAPLWQRIEYWTAYRWGLRSVTWVIEGPGEWVPRLRPVASID